VPRFCRSCGRGHSLYIPRVLCGPLQRFLFISRVSTTRRPRGTLERRAMICSATAYCHGGLRFSGVGSSFKCPHMGHSSRSWLSRNQQVCIGGACGPVIYIPRRQTRSRISSFGELPTGGA